MPTSEQRGHFGLSTKGGGMTRRAAVARSSSQQFAGAVHQRLVEGDGDAFAGIDVIQDAAFAEVAVFPQDQPLAQSCTCSGSQAWPGTSGTWPCL